MIRTATGALLWPLLEEIETSDQVLKSGGAVTYPLPTVPISLIRSYLHHPQAVDIPLPVETPQLTGKQLDLLRAAMSLLLKYKVAKAAFQSWNESRARPTAYRTNGFLNWHEQLLRICLETWFPDAEYQSDRTLILSDTQRQQAEQEQAIDEILRRSIDLLTDPSKYSAKIIERPASCAEWEAAVQNGTLAFWYTPQKGGDEGTTFLTFTSKTLKALISRAGCTEDLYDAFLNRCSNQELLDNKNRTINLGKRTIAAVTFFVKRL